MTGSELRQWRIKNNLSQQALAEMIGYSRYALLRCEKAKEKEIPKKILLLINSLKIG